MLILGTHKSYNQWWGSNKIFSLLLKSRLVTRDNDALRIPATGYSYVRGHPQSNYYNLSKELREVGKKRLSGDTERNAAR